MAAPYNNAYYGKDKKHSDGKRYLKEFYNIRDLPSLDEEQVLTEVWRSVHDYVGKRVAGNDAVISVPFLEDNSYFYPYAVMTKSVKERPAKYTMYPHLCEFVTPETKGHLDTLVSVKQVEDEVVYEIKGLTGFGWDDPKGALHVIVTCSDVTQLSIPHMSPKAIRLDLELLNPSAEFLKENVGERLYMVGKVFAAASMKIEVIISTVDTLYRLNKKPTPEPFMRFEREISPRKEALGIPICFLVQKLFLDPSSSKKVFKEGVIPSHGTLVDKMDFCDNIKFKTGGLWLPRETHPMDPKPQECQED